jgi:beta-galactosidase
MKKAFVGALLLVVNAPAFASTDYPVDAAATPPPPSEGHLSLGTARGPSGLLGVNARYLTRDGRPWFPVMGEFHFSRYPEAEWNIELGKMKAQGIDIVSSYVIWNEIELDAGKLDWTGARNLRKFVELCRANGLLFYLRPGPWAHAETRFGGIPDWVEAKGGLRSDDPIYLQSVRRFWRGIAGELHGLLWKDGGPVIGMQIENEYNLVGSRRGAGHIATLRALAKTVGLDVPLYTVTGWDRAVYPRGQVAPVFGGYPDEPWATATTKLAPKENYLFRFDSRVSGGLGAQTVNTGSGPADADRDRDLTPFLGAEYGPGVPTMYRRRPIIQPDDIQAQMITQIGSGLNLVGYYMFHGGANPLAGGRGLEETTRTGSFNDVPMIGYDFQAPLGQYGERRPVADVLRPLHMFIHAFGERLATMTVRRPAELPHDAADTGSLRYAARSDGRHGFLFVNNHIRQYAMPQRRDVRFAITTASGTLHFPADPATIPDGASFIWPFNMDLAGVPIAWASAQPITMISDDRGPLFVFMKTPGVRPAFAFDIGTAVNAPTHISEGKLIADLTPSRDRIIRVRGLNGKSVRILLLDAADGRRLWTGPIAGRQTLVLSDAEVRFSGDGVVLTSNSPKISATLYPRTAMATDQSMQIQYREDSSALAITLPQRPVRTLAVEQLRMPGQVAPIEIGGAAHAAVQPASAAFAASGAWRFTVPRAFDRDGRDWLQIDYAGDIARLFDDEALLDDRFWDGRRWDIALDRFDDRVNRSWLLTVLPLRKDAPIYLDGAAKAQLRNEQTAEVRSVRIVPEYDVVIRTAGKSL